LVLTFSRYFAITIEASHTVVPRCSELGFWDSLRTLLHHIRSLDVGIWSGHADAAMLAGYPTPLLWLV
jgi:hypothetical protein